MSAHEQQEKLYIFRLRFEDAEGVFCLSVVSNPFLFVEDKSV